jgi:phosphoglycolate phosphatase
MTAGDAAVIRLPRPRAILFDWDNTLVDSWGTIHEALNLTFAQMGTPSWSMAETQARVRHSLRDSFPKLFGDDWEHARALYLGHFEALHLERLITLPGAAELIAALHAEGFYLGVVSNKTGRLLRREVAALGWEQWFARVVGAGDAAADKPDPVTVSLALESSGIVPGDDVWFVGDTDIDMQCARNAGCLPVWIGAAPEPAATPPTPSALHFETCDEMRRALLLSSHLQYEGRTNKL